MIFFGFPQESSGQAVSTENVEITQEDLPEGIEISAVSPEFVGPPIPLPQPEILQPGRPEVESQPRPPVEIYSDYMQQVPVLRLNGNYFDPSGLASTGTLSSMTNQALHARMLKTFNMGFKCFFLRVSWPGLEPEADRINTTRVQELLDYAYELGLKVIIAIELSRAPAWFFQGELGSDRLTFSFLVDPERERSVGSDGALRWPDGSGHPLMYHPDTMRAVSELIYSLYYSLKDKKALLGWMLDGPVSFAFPGGGINGVVGITDYSPFTVNRYFEATESDRMPYPLTRYSENSWDKRVDFRTFMNLRLEWKRLAFESALKTLREVDKEHLVLIGMDPVLNYRNDNGYLSRISSPDATWQIHQTRVNGAVIGFRLASDSFSALSNRSETSASHLALTINHLLRNRKLAIVLIEADSVNPPAPQDITQIAEMIKAAGAYPIWSSGYLQKHGPQWSWADENAIESSQPLSLLPPPKRFRRGNVAIVDMPRYYSTFYCDRNGTLVDSMLQVAIHQRSGVVLEMIGIDELLLGYDVLQDYTNLIFLDDDPLNIAEARSWISPAAQVALSMYRSGNGIIETVDPLLINQYKLENFRAPVLEDQLRTRYVHRGATADLLHGGDAVIIANDPYVFIRINSLGHERYIDVKLAGWPEANLAYADFADLPEGSEHRIDMNAGSASFHYGPSKNVSHLYVMTDDFAPFSKMYEGRMTGVAIAQQTRNMRRSMPAAFLLAILLIVTLLWMSFQSQQKSLLQAAELEDRRRRIEPIDMLDDEEVMAIYRKYVSETSIDVPDDRTMRKIVSDLDEFHERII